MIRIERQFNRNDNLDQGFKLISKDMIKGYDYHINS